MKRNKTITEKDIYHFYPYRKNPIVTGKTIPQPYVKKEEESNHPHSLTYNEWKGIIDDYLIELRNHLYNGKLYTLPKQLGTLQLKKYKTYKQVDWNETNKQKKKVFYNDINSYNVIIKWFRSVKNSNFVFKFHWKIRMTSTFRRDLSKRLNDPNYIYNIVDV